MALVGAIDLEGELELEGDEVDEAAKAGEAGTVERLGSRSSEVRGAAPATRPSSERIGGEE